MIAPAITFYPIPFNHIRLKNLRYTTMKKIQLLSLCLIAAFTAAAQDFDKYFENKTLRLDYIFGATPTSRTVLLDRQTRIPGWAGRRHRLNELPYIGNGQITVRDAASGDTIYRTSFSSLYNEWLATPEAQQTPRAFENVFLVPYPKAPAIIDIAVLDYRHDVMASMSHRFDPADILVKDAATHGILPHRYIHKSSSPETAIDVAILAEGYTPEQMDDFYRDAQTAVDAILSHEPFRSRADVFNFVAVASPSRDSGVSVPLRNEWRDTAFGSHFSTFYSDRYLTTSNVKAIHDALNGIPYEHIIILSNSDVYGGGGIYNSYTLTDAGHKDFRPVVVHEFGHSFGGLADEYFYDTDVMSGSYPLDVEPWEPNITSLVDFSSKWQPILKKGTPVPTPVADSSKFPVGIYEGAGYSSKGLYRPADNCRMRTNAHPEFCPACQRALNLLIDFYVK